MSVDYPRLLGDLKAESDQLTTVIAGLRPDQWDQMTPAPGWTIRDQISHLAFFDEATVTAIRAPEQFSADAAELMADGMDFPDRIAARYRTTPGGDLLDWFVSSRAQLMATLADSSPRDRLPWFGPDMSVASSATARLMETWAHGHDIYDTVEVEHPARPGLRSIAHLGISTFAFSHRLNDREVPTAPIRIELTAPDGSEVWTWGPDDAEDVVVGPALDFVLVVTQRRHVADTTLTVTGDTATSWLQIAQAFAGAPGQGRSPSHIHSPSGGLR